MRTPARLSENHLQSMQRKTSAWPSEKHLVLTTNTNRMKFYRMIISLMVVDEEILYGGHSLTAVAMRGRASMRKHLLHNILNNLLKACLEGRHAFIILSRAKWCPSGIQKLLVDCFTLIKSVNSNLKKNKKKAAGLGDQGSETWLDSCGQTQGFSTRLFF